MEVFTLLIALIALIIAILAFQRTGGIHDLRRQMDDLSEKTDYATKGARDMTADALSRLEVFIRGQQKASPTVSDPPDVRPPPTSPIIPSEPSQKATEEHPQTKEDKP